jgi:hypothetical protein
MSDPNTEGDYEPTKPTKARSIVKLALQDCHCGLLMHILKTGVERFLQGLLKHILKIFSSKFNNLAKFSL